MLVVLLVVKGNEGEFIGEVGLQLGERHLGQIGRQVLKGRLICSVLLGSARGLLGRCRFGRSFLRRHLSVSFQVLDFVVVNVGVLRAESLFFVFGTFVVRLVVTVLIVFAVYVESCDSVSVNS